MIRKTILLLTLTALVLPTAAFAAKPGKKRDKGAVQAARGYDANSNGQIDGDEVTALRKAFESDKGGALKSFDKNFDGKLDDTEIAAIKVGKRKKNK
jgi:hypothetical protein